MTAHETFAKKAPWLMAKLMKDFALSIEDTAAIAGNLGHECLGFTVLQEKRPAIKGSRGGYGWAQWTGPRRRAYEAWAKAKGLDVASDEANYGFLVHELHTSEAEAIRKLRNASGLKAKVIAFEAGFERAGVKHYDSRQAWAERALAAWEAANPKSPIPDVEPIPVPAPPSKTAGKSLAGFILAAILAAIVAGLGFIFGG